MRCGKCGGIEFYQDDKGNDICKGCNALVFKKATGDKIAEDLDAAKAKLMAIRADLYNVMRLLDAQIARFNRGGKD